MTIQPVKLNSIQTNPVFQQDVKPYREAEGTIKTENRVKPLPPKGHLVDDDLVTGTKYYFKDIAYDMKSVKNGLNGTANDHQLGRLNDVGLKLGGIGIATYLASRTTNPKARLMEYVGLASFLTSMALYPKLAINAPARVLHGYDIDKQYIDDQGRKKSVQQDSNYVPYDMYIGGNKGEDLDAIGDRMGIPRDIKNRHDVIREQMRKIATQNNTLWMLTAGFATPVMTALICNGLENYVIGPGLEKSRNAKYNAQIENVLSKSEKMDSDISGLNNNLSKQVEKILKNFQDKSLPKEDFDNIVNLLTENTDSILSEGIKIDLENMLSEKTFVVSSSGLDNLLKEGISNIKGTHRKEISDAIIPSKAELESIIKSIKPNANLDKGCELSSSEFSRFKTELSNKISSKIEQATGSLAEHKDFLESSRNDFIQTIKLEQKSLITQEIIEKTVNFAKIIGDFKEKSIILDKCQNFKFEHTPETILARYYAKFQNSLVKHLGISSSELSKMRNDAEYTQKVLDEKIQALCKDESKFTKTFEDLGGIMADMEKALHGSNEEKSHIQDLINGIDNVYNNTAKRLNDNNIGKNTINRLVKEDISALSKTVETKDDLIKMLDGISEDKFKGNSSNEAEYIKYHAKGKGSSKNLKIRRLLSRYQGEVNSFYRIFHTLDFYKRAANSEAIAANSTIKTPEYIQKLVEQSKFALLKGNITDSVLKYDMVNNPMGYKDFVNTLCADEGGETWATTQKGLVSDTTKNALSKGKKSSKGNILERFQYYITHKRNLLANNETDFTKPEHKLNSNINNLYTDSAKMNEALFNLVGQNPVDMLQKAAKQKHGDRIWLKKMSIIGGAIMAVTLLAQFGFGKISNKHNLQKIQPEQKNNKTKNKKSKKASTRNLKTQKQTKIKNRKQVKNESSK